MNPMDPQILEKIADAEVYLYNNYPWSVFEVEGVPIIDIPVNAGSLVALPPNIFGFNLKRSGLLSDFFMEAYGSTEELVKETVRNQYINIINMIKSYMAFKSAQYIIIQRTRQAFYSHKLQNIDYDCFYGGMILGLGGFFLPCPRQEQECAFAGEVVGDPNQLVG